MDLFRIEVSELPTINKLEDEHDVEQISLRIYGSPISLKSSGTKKTNFFKAIQSRLAPIDFVLTGDIAVRITWYLHPQIRFESDASPDVDNIIKPLLDSLCGQKGIIVDDCQVSNVSCSWIDCCGDEHLDVVIEFRPIDYLPKKEIVFIHLEKGICIPFIKNLSYQVEIEAFKHAVDRIQIYLKARETDGYYNIHYSLLPLVALRFFHISRLRDFRIFSYTDFIEYIGILPEG